MGTSPKFIEEYGLDPSLNLSYTVSHLRDSIKPKDPLNKHLHGLSQPVIKRVVEKLDEPAMVFYNPEDSRGILYIMVDEFDPDPNNKVPIIAYLEPWATEIREGKRNLHNHILSIYAYNSEQKFKELMNKVIRSKTVLKIDKSKVGFINAGNPGLLMSGIGMLKKADFTNSIKNYGKTVKEIIDKKRKDPRYKLYQKQLNDSYKRVKAALAKFCFTIGNFLPYIKPKHNL